MKKIKFNLTHPVRITPLKGQTEVKLATTGDFLVNEYKGQTSKKAPSIPIASTERGSLTSSPQGMFVTLKVILPARMASEREFHRQVNLLYDTMLVDNV